MENPVVVVNGSLNRPVKLTELGVRQVIDKGTTLRGDMICSSSILIRGKVFGNIEVKCDNAMVIVHPDGEIYGNVRANIVIVAGKIDGGVDCKGIRICRSGSVLGKLNFSEIRMEYGGILRSEHVNVTSSLLPSEDTEQQAKEVLEEFPHDQELKENQEAGENNREEKTG